MTSAGAVAVPHAQLPRIGLLLGNQRRLPDLRAQYAAVRDEAGAALGAGIDLLVAPEHLASPPYAMLRPWPLLAALGAELGGFDAVGSVVAGLTSLAQLTGDIESASAAGHGRVGAALAAGYHADDFAAASRDFGARWDARAQARRTLTRRVEPDLLWSAAGTPRAAAAAAVDGVTWYAPATTTEDDMRALADASGRAGVLRCDVLLAEPDELSDRWARYVEPKYGALGRWGFDSAATPAATVLAGPPEVVAERLRSRSTPSTHTVIVRLCWPDMDAATALEHVTSFGRHVLPLLQPTALAAGATSVGSP